MPPCLSQQSETSRHKAAPTSNHRQIDTLPPISSPILSFPFLVLFLVLPRNANPRTKNENENENDF